MGFRDCIDQAEEDGEIDPERAARIREIMDEELSSLHNYPPDEAEAEAGRRALARLDAASAESARRNRLAMKVAGEIRERILSRRDNKGRFDPGAALPDLIEHFGTTPHSSVNGRYEVIIGRAHGQMVDVIERFERDFKGTTRNQAELQNVVREAFGEDTGDASARELAVAWSGSAEALRIRRNAAGGNTARLENWGLPQSHNALAIDAAKEPEWSSFLKDRLDRSAMIDSATGQPISEGALDAAISDAFDAITSDGWSNREAKFSGGGMALASRRAEARFFVFKSPDAWLEYQERFGNGDPFAAMMAHLDGMARDIAQMEILGPNPAAMLRFAEQLATKEAKEGRAQGRTRLDLVTGGGAVDGVKSKVRSDASLMRRMAAEFNGTARSPIDGKLARSLGTLINVKYSAQLGSAFLTALSDESYGRSARQFIGMPNNSPLVAAAKLMDPRNGDDRHRAVRSGLIAQDAVQKMLGQSRYVEQFAAFNWSKRIADVSLRVSVLSPETQAMKWAFGMDFFAWTADQAGVRWGDLDGPVQRLYERYGLGEAEWDIIRRAPKSDPEAGGGFITPEDIARLEGDDLDPDNVQRLAERFLEMVHTETGFAVPSATLRGKAFLTPEGLRPGTLMHILVSSATMYKSFISSMTMMYFSRGAAEAARAGGTMAARFAARLFFLTTAMGALIIQFKEITKGRDFRPMNTLEFWMAAQLQGGGAGIYGDYLFSDVNRYGGGLPTTIAGPVIETIDDVGRFTVGNIQEALSGDETHLGREAVRLLRRNTPGATNWYTRLATDRLIFDQLQRLADPEAEDNFRRAARRREREYGAGYYWAPGDPAPDRLPDLGNAGAPPPR